jgi:uncharacterized protein YlxW (UPF0749 family)
MKRLRPVLQVSLVTFVLGVLIAVQLSSTGRTTSAMLNSSDEARVLAMLVQSNAGLRNEISGLEAQLARLAPSNSEERIAALQAELSRLLVISGDAETGGPGVRVDVSGQINPLDMQDLINELRNAGAEAIALNGQRITMRSVVTREAGELVLNGVRLYAPYILEAISQPDTIEKALLRPGGMVSLLEYAYPGLSVTVSKADGLVLPARTARPEFRFAQPAQ